MSAEIIDFQAWRRAHRASEPRFARIPFLVPTWPWGWLQPALVEVEFGMPVGFGGKTDVGGRSDQKNAWASRAAGCERATAMTGRLSVVPPSKGGQKL
jgi:hypothetical protein